MQQQRRAARGAGGAGAPRESVGRTLHSHSMNHPALRASSLTRASAVPRRRVRLRPVPPRCCLGSSSSSGRGSGRSERAVRLAKVEQLMEQGWEYAAAPKYKRTHTAGEVQQQYSGLGPGEQVGVHGAPGEYVAVSGRVMACRWFGKLGFISVQDGSGRVQLQMSADGFGSARHGTTTPQGQDDQSMAGEHVVGSIEGAKQWLDVGDIVCARADAVRKTKRGEVSLVVSACQLLSKATRPLPEKFHGLRDVELRYRRRPLDFLTNVPARRVIEQRSAIMAHTRSYLQGLGFIEVETPLLHASTGGASARPFTTHHHALDCDFALRIAPELYLKQLLVGGFEKVFELGRVLRNEGISPRHNPEFTSLELYEAYADVGTMMEALEGLVSSAALAVRGTTRLSYSGGASGREELIDVTPPWRRVSMVDLVREHTGIDFTSLREVGEAIEVADAALATAAIQVVSNAGGADGAAADDSAGGAAAAAATAARRYRSCAAARPTTVGGVMAHVFEELVEPSLRQPTLVFDYPRESSPLARTHRCASLARSVQGGLVERFEAFVCGWELANAFSELTDPAEQRRRFEEQAARRAQGDSEAHGVDEVFMRELEQGMPPAGGLGVGMDRLTMLLTDQQSIREVIAFPTLSHEDFSGGGPDPTHDADIWPAVAPATRSNG
jgi:lysyl-tRNA synthetase class 2